ncbi:MAG TPA: PQQ-dependent sugar dehydrogenase [Bacteroidia bacterium]|nr:PQQ-dependent sugar dehydrogenase [Bacteroidia bacterium]HNT79723.1 PQQ-dependent sugar dehydrogenase [Bacteroidia bacterium]
MFQIKKSILIYLVSFFIHQSSISAQNVQLQFFTNAGAKVTDVTHANDDRIFIALANGVIKISDLFGNTLADPFLNISNKVNSATLEQGLLGLAFSPNYYVDSSFYVNYTNSQGSNVISRFKTSKLNANKADSTSEQVLLTIAQPFPNHNGGSIQFGPDGFLYIAVGDGGSGGDPLNHAQDSSSLLGKILRIDVNELSANYSIPASNPFVSKPGYAEEIWALGLRNPWRISFDRMNGDLWISDVGELSYEEINLQTAGSKGGENYGWRCYEALAPFNLSQCGISTYAFPVFDYLHNIQNGCSVTGGYVSRSAKYKSHFGQYFFSDFCSGRIWSLHDSLGVWVNTIHGSFIPWTYSTFGQDRYGDLYIAEFNTGNISKLVSTFPCDLLAHFSFSDSLSSCGSAMELKALYHTDLNYQWYFNGNLLNTHSTSDLNVNQSGYYSLVVSDSLCADTSKSIYVDLTDSQTGSIQLLDSVFCQQTFNVQLFSDVLIKEIWINGQKIEQFNPRDYAAGVYDIEVYYIDSLDCFNYFTHSISIVSCSEDLQIFPNPFDDFVDIIFYSTTTAPYSLTLYDAIGRRVRKDKHIAKAGQNHISLQMDELSKGHYTLRLNIKENNYSKSIIKIH